MRTLVGEREMMFHACSGKTGWAVKISKLREGRGHAMCDEMPGNGEEKDEDGCSCFKLEM